MTRTNGARVALAPVRYHGTPPHRVHVITAGVALPLEHHVRHSPTGYSWGYNGSGPADLALALLWDALGAEPHPSLYQRYKASVVARWHSDAEWDTTRDDVRDWVLSVMRAPDPGLVMIAATGTPLIREDGDG